jgi:hypothetical protein
MLSFGWIKWNFMLNTTFVTNDILVNARTLYLIGTWRTTQENSVTTVSYGSDTNQLIGCVDYLIALPKGQKGSKLKGIARSSWPQLLLRCYH